MMHLGASVTCFKAQSGRVVQVCMQCRTCLILYADGKSEHIGVLMHFNRRLFTYHGHLGSISMEYG